MMQQKKINIVIKTSGSQPRRWHRPRGPLTSLGVLMLSVSEGEIGVGPAGQTGAAPRSCAPAPQPHRVLRGQHGVSFHVSIGASPHGVATVREPHICPVEGSMRGCHLTQPQLPQAEVGSWEEKQESTVNALVQAHCCSLSSLWFIVPKLASWLRDFCLLGSFCFLPRCAVFFFSF